MKRSMFFSRMLVSVMFVLVCGFVSAAINEGNFIHNDVVKDGQIMSREVYEQSSGILTPVKKYTFVYDENQQMTQKTIFAWNSNKKRWEEDSQVAFGYQNNELTVELYAWNKSKNTFIPTEKNVYVTEGNDTTQHIYKMNSRTKEWILEKSTKSEAFNAFASR